MDACDGLVASCFAPVAEKASRECLLDKQRDLLALLAMTIKDTKEMKTSVPLNVIHDEEIVLI